jgi:hypothetical protein
MGSRRLAAAINDADALPVSVNSHRRKHEWHRNSFCLPLDEQDAPGEEHLAALGVDLCLNLQGRLQIGG